jgi:hypothetical protein
MRPLNRRGISARALEVIGAESREPAVFSALRRVKSPQQDKIVQMMSMSGDLTSGFLELLVVASPSSAFVRKKHHPKGLRRDEIKFIEDTLRPLEKAFCVASITYREHAYLLDLTRAYLRRIMRSERMTSYLKIAQPERYAELQVLELDWLRGRDYTQPAARGGRSPKNSPPPRSR